MSLPAALFRALLCLFLLLNGSGYAHADALAMAMAPAMASMQPDADAQAAATPPCHEAADQDQDAPAEQNRSDLPGHVGHPDDGMGDCCSAGACDGFCAQHVPVLFRALALMPVQANGRDMPAYRPAAHPTPRLLHRWRPPILSA